MKNKKRIVASIVLTAVLLVCGCGKEKQERVETLSVFVDGKRCELLQKDGFSEAELTPSCKKKSDDESVEPTYSFASGNKKIVRVDESGKLHAVGVGETFVKITAQTQDGDYGTKKVPVVVYEPIAESDARSFDETFVNKYGRTYMQGSELILEHVASAVEFTFFGTSLSLKTTSSNAYLRAEIDGEPKEERFSVSSTQTLSLASGLSEKIHTVRVLKCSDLNDSRVRVQSVSTDGTFLKCASKSDLKIEFIGDSITSGYGVLGKSGDARTVGNSDATSSYAYLTARALEADYSVVSLSGICVKAYLYHRNMNMLTLYDQVSLVETKADEQKFDADFVVLNLGTNDGSYIKTHSGYTSEFSNDYLALLKKIRKKRKNAKIVCVYGMMGTDPTVQNGIRSAMFGLNDPNVYYKNFTADGSGANGHPSKSAAIRASETLSAYLTTLL